MLYFLIFEYPLLFVSSIYTLDVFYVRRAVGLVKTASKSKCTHHVYIWKDKAFIYTCSLNYFKMHYFNDFQEAKTYLYCGTLEIHLWTCNNYWIWKIHLELQQIVVGGPVSVTDLFQWPFENELPFLNVMFHTTEHNLDVIYRHLTSYGTKNQ